jgi:hypothetical protein
VDNPTAFKPASTVTPTGEPETGVEGVDMSRYGIL